jgi:hypothetical protein
MKKFGLLFLFLLLAAQLLRGQATLVGWDFNGLSSFGSSPLTPTNSDANLTLVGLTRGSGITTSGTAGANAWGGNGLNETTEAAALSGNDYITFSMTANTDYTLSVYSINAYNVRRSSTGCTTGQWQYQIGSGAFVDIGGDITWGSTTTSAGNSQSAINLSAITDLQNVAAGTTITFRCILWGGSSATGNWYLNNFQAGNDFIIDGTPEAVPVELSSFSAYVRSEAVNLKWETKTEINNYGFEIERSSFMTSPIQGWTKIGFVNGHGNSNSPKDYSFTDRSITNGKYIYRLKQIDTDGKYEYSKEVEVDLGLPKAYALCQNYPNPFNPTTIINYTLPVEGNVQLQIFTIEGELVKSLVNEKQNVGSYSIEFNAGNLASGTYIYKLRAGNFVQTKKMTLTK